MFYTAFIPYSNLSEIKTDVVFHPQRLQIEVGLNQM